MGKAISRRKAMGTLVMGAGAAALSAPLSIKGTDKSSSRDLVLVEGQMFAALDKALEHLGGISRFVRSGDKVVIKPNVSFSSGPEVGANTHPALVASVARKCAEAGAREILICDYPLHKASACLKGSGISEALKGVPKTRFVFFTEKKFFRKVDVPTGEVLQNISILDPVLDSDVFINMPKAKSHGGTTVTLSLKNLMGVMWERKSFHIIHDIHQAIADLATVVRPNLTILDATTAMVTGGPGGPGNLEHPKILIAGKNQLEVDALGVSLAKWYGKDMTARDIPHLFNAYRLGLGQIDIEKLQYKRLRV